MSLRSSKKIYALWIAVTITVTTSFGASAFWNKKVDSDGDPSAVNSDKSRLSNTRARTRERDSLPAGLNKKQVAESITQYAKSNRFPLQVPFDHQQQEVIGNIDYTFDLDVQEQMADVYLRYRPDYASFVAMDADTGEILSMLSFMRNPEDLENLNLRADYPAASVFKIVTAVAGIEMGEVSSSSVIPYNGKSTTLYKSQVLRHKNNKWTRTPTLKESFAKSVNPVFARLGVNQVGGSSLKTYAEKLGFEQDIDSDLQVPQSRLNLDFSQEWPIAEAASGYTRDITLSPLHAAQIAAAVINGGKLVRPHVVREITSTEGTSLYTADTAKVGEAFSSATAQQLQDLMQATTKIGSARGSFRDIRRYRVYRDMRIGGKTGSLTGYSPKGRHDWFVGFAEKQGRRVAYASLIIKQEKWYVRSAYVARQFIYHYFSKHAESALADLSNGDRQQPQTLN